MSPQWRGLCSLPSAAMALPLQEGGVQFWSCHSSIYVGNAFSGCRVYLDGSCSKPWDKTAARAGWSVVSIGPDGSLRAALTGPVLAAWPQTSPMAEFMAAQALAQVAGPQTEPVVDYKGILQVLGGGRQADLAHSRVMAGVVRLAQTSQGWANLVKFHWAKAHQDPAVAEKGSEAWLDILGNFLADVKAKEAVLQHPPAQGGEMDRAQSDGERMTRWLQYVGKAVVLWPGHAKFKKLPKRHRQKELAARAVVVHDRLQTAVGDQAHQHDWQWRASASRWVCSKCLRHTTVRQKFRTGCAGLAKNIRCSARRWVTRWLPSTWSPASLSAALPVVGGATSTQRVSSKSAGVA